MRAQQEIADRYQKAEGDDLFGFKQEVLAAYLDYENAKPYLREGVTRERWQEMTAEIPEPAKAGAEYFPFAVSKCEDERGISATRSVMKLAEWAWLDGQDDLAAEMEAEGNYGWYGRGALELYAEHYGLAWGRGEY